MTEGEEGMVQVRNRMAGDEERTPDRESVLERASGIYMPGSEDIERMEQAVARLLGKANEILAETGNPENVSTEVVGSAAKNTYLRGGDIDLFLLVPIGMDQGSAWKICREVGVRLLEDHTERYASHPYVSGNFDAIGVDVVWAYRVPSGDLIQSAVDRTPFHTRYVNENLAPSGRKDVRLFKQFLMGCGLYSASLRVSGVSGYLAELMVIRYGSFEGVISAIARWTKRCRVEMNHPQMNLWVSSSVLADRTAPLHLSEASFLKTKQESASPLPRRELAPEGAATSGGMLAEDTDESLIHRVPKVLRSVNGHPPPNGGGPRRGFLRMDERPNRNGEGKDRFGEARLVFIDPVDPRRNVAAALSDENYHRLIAASRSFLRAPSLDHFTESKHTPCMQESLSVSLAGRGTTLLSVTLPRPEVVDDILYPQLYKARQGIKNVLVSAGFVVLGSAIDVRVAGELKRMENHPGNGARSDLTNVAEAEVEGVHRDDKETRHANERGNVRKAVEREISGTAAIIFEVDRDTVPSAMMHSGPPVYVDRAQDFIDKWSVSPDALSQPFVEEGRWRVIKKRKTTDLAETVRERMPDISLGKDLDRMAKVSCKVRTGPEVINLHDPDAIRRLLDRGEPWMSIK